jgi:hypothetical protein
MSEQETKQSIASKIASVPVANISGNTAITGTLSVSGVTTLQAAVTLQAGVTIAGNTSVTGKTTLTTLKVSGLTAYADNAAAVTGGLAVGDIYTNSSTYALTIVHA